jgi:hypothetical protein
MSGENATHTRSVSERERERALKETLGNGIDFVGLVEGRVGEQGLRKKLTYQPIIQKVSFWDETQPNPTPPVHQSGWMVH